MPIRTGMGTITQCRSKVGGEIDEATGMVVDLGELDRCIRREVLEPFDHSNLNTLETFRGLVPTTENLLIEIQKRLRKALPECLTLEVRVEETSNNSSNIGKKAAKERSAGKRPAKKRLARGERKAGRMGRTAVNGNREKLDREVIGTTGLENVTTQDIYREIIRRYDADPTRDGLEKTPERVEKTLEFLTKGYREDPKQVLHGALFDVAYDEMVIVKDIEMYSLCEHHMLPFFGKVHVAYIPRKGDWAEQGAAAGGFVRAAAAVAGAADAADCGGDSGAIHPQGVGVVIEARHLCMMMRGVEKQNSSTVTSAMLGVFQKQNTRAEFLSLIRERTASAL